ncbi:ACT domain-containing protein [Pontixanthobacter aestiaquae]|uniref:ACT domain-containing protein n=1 Tax=Pontixanthobacter aestiaquae TaxID=1509367 RepID=A0A844Z254_9SPHN|nr:ACT domain-containing protein [Pontixanthobacter aestiaquae]MDN3646227.1 ACT domain-containing protein [Pontixanthobacter aestiaquae]MXO82781.1 ACT domain-containing protein [Pontixanthobacter aestiaquae]
MGGVVTESIAMIGGMSPQLDPQVWRFVQVSPETASQLLGAAIGTFREEEGVSAIVPSVLADELGIAGPDFCCITLQVHSDLVGVGLTAAVSRSLADAGIACNIVAAFHHDHVFVPAALSKDALAVLIELSGKSLG